MAEMIGEVLRQEKELFRSEMMDPFSVVDEILENDAVRKDQNGKIRLNRAMVERLWPDFGGDRVGPSGIAVAKLGEAFKGRIDPEIKEVAELQDVFRTLVKEVVNEGKVSKQLMAWTGFAVRPSLIGLGGGLEDAHAYFAPALPYVVDTLTEMRKGKGERKNFPVRDQAEYMGIRVDKKGIGHMSNVLREVLPKGFDLTNEQLKIWSERVMLGHELGHGLMWGMILQTAEGRIPNNEKEVIEIRDRWLIEMSGKWPAKSPVGNTIELPIRSMEERIAVAMEIDTFRGLLEKSGLTEEVVDRCIWTYKIKRYSEMKSQVSKLIVKAEKKGLKIGDMDTIYDIVVRKVVGENMFVNMFGYYLGYCYPLTEEQLRDFLHS